MLDGILNQSTVKTIVVGMLAAALFSIIRNRIDAIDGIMDKLEGLAE